MISKNRFAERKREKLQTVSHQTTDDENRPFQKQKCDDKRRPHKTVLLVTVLV